MYCRTEQTIESRSTSCLKNMFAWRGAAALAGLTMMSLPAAAQQPLNSNNGHENANILFIMGDDIGWMQLVSYQQGLRNR